MILLINIKVPLVSLARALIHIFILVPVRLALIINIAISFLRPVHYMCCCLEVKDNLLDNNESSKKLKRRSYSDSPIFMCLIILLIAGGRLCDRK